MKLILKLSVHLKQIMKTFSGGIYHAVAFNTIFRKKICGFNFIRVMIITAINRINSFQLIKAINYLKLLIICI